MLTGHCRRHCVSCLLPSAVHHFNFPNGSRSKPSRPAAGQIDSEIIDRACKRVTTRHSTFVCGKRIACSLQSCQPSWACRRCKAWHATADTTFLKAGLQPSSIAHAFDCMDAKVSSWRGRILSSRGTKQVALSCPRIVKHICPLISC